MANCITSISLVVRDYDEAIQFYTESLRFSLLEDTPLPDGKRWVLVSPASGCGASLLLAKAATPEQESCIGNQTGGRVFLFLQTDNFREDYQYMLSKGVRFTEEPRQEAYGTVVVFQDLYGNKWDLIGKIPDGS
ncbi:MAG: glyoxalase [Anaerolinea sp.]|nr:glyoxalase [Anaerolinea sp.]